MGARLRTLTSRLRSAVARKPGRTATQLAHALKADPASVSSLLYRWVVSGSLFRTTGVKGPRGGWTYFPVPENEELRRWLSGS